MKHHVIAHVDMDCFFAACHRKHDTSLVGKPLIVGGKKNSQRGVVSTASYEAREFGVHSAMPIKKAAQLCPDGIFLQSDFTLYKKESQAIMQLLHSFSTDFLQVSVDEAYIDITHLVKSKDDMMRVAKEIRKTIYKQTGHTCSVGVAHSKRVAKIASDFKKPHGITVVYHAKNFLAPLAIKKIPGIGKKSLPIYQQWGIETIGDLAKKDVFFVMEHFGKTALSFWRIARGEDFSYNLTNSKEKSYSTETTFEKDVSFDDSLLQTLFDLCQSVMRRAKKCLYRTVSLKLRYNDFQTITRSYSFDVATNSFQQFFQTVKDLFLNCADVTKKIRLIGVKLDNIIFTREVQKTLMEF